MSNKQYHIGHANGTTEGPYDEATITTAYHNGTYPAGTLVWCVGMANWEKIEAVFPAPEPPPIVPPLPPVPAPPPAEPENPPVAKPEPEHALVAPHRPTPKPAADAERPCVSLHDIVNPQYFNNELWLCIGLLAGGVFFSFLIPAFFVTFPNPFTGRIHVVGGIGSLICSLLSLGCWVAGIVLFCIHLFKGWKILEALPESTGRPSAGAAVGFSFIPFFNFYWVFISFGKFSTYANMFLKRPQAIAHWPFFTFAITIAAWLPWRFLTHALGSRTLDNFFDSLYMGGMTALMFLMFCELNKLISLGGSLEQTDAP